MERQKRKLKGIADLYNIEDERLKRQPSPAEDVSEQNIPKQDISEETISRIQELTPHIPCQNISEETTSHIPAISTELSPQETDIHEVEANAQISKDDIISQDTPQQDISH